MFRKLFCLGAATLTVLVIAGQAVRGDEAVLLRYKMPEGEQQIYRTVTNLTQTQKADDREFKTEMSNTDIAVRTLEKTDEDGNFVVRTENKLLKVEITSPLGKYVYDSSNNERDTASALGQGITPVYDRLNGAVLTFRLSPRSKLLAVDGYKELMADAFKDNFLAEQIAGGGSNEAAVQSMASLFVELSDNPVKPGDTWETTYSINLKNIGDIDGKKIYTYEGPDKVGDRVTARISVTHELSADLDIKFGQATGTGTFSTSKSSGTVQFDPEKGQVVLLETNFELGGDLVLNVAGKATTVHTAQNQSVRHELLEKLPEPSAAPK